MKLNRVSVEDLYQSRERVNEEPENFGARLELAQILDRFGFFSDAIEQFRLLINQRPDSRSLKFQLYKLLHDSEQFTEAVSLMKEMLPDDPTPYEVYSRIGRSLQADGMLDEALPYFRKTIEHIPAGTTSSHIRKALVGFSGYLDDKSFAAKTLAEILCIFSSKDSVSREALLKLAAIEPAHPEVLRCFRIWQREEPKNKILMFLPIFEKLPSKDYKAAKAVLLELPYAYRTSEIWCGLMKHIYPAWFIGGELGLKYVTRRSVPNDLAAVTCYYNPRNSEQRRNGYLEFRRHLERTEVPLLTVELAFGDNPFELGQFEDIIQLRSDAYLWQKERLLNIGIGELIKRGYDKIAWLDADIVFENPDWGSSVSKVLDLVPVCQTYDLVHRKRWETDPGVYEQGEVYRSTELEIIRQKKRITGFAWAARAELLDAVPLFDVNITGGGDVNIAVACYWNDIPDIMETKFASMMNTMSSEMAEYYDSWATAWWSKMKGKVSHAPLSIQTVFHGALSDRLYGKRRKILKQYGFSPREDLELDENLCWKWSTKKIELKQQVQWALTGEQPGA